MYQLEKTITSLEVAEMVGRRHDQVLRDITKIKGHLTDHKSVASELFIDSTYEDASGRELPCYLLTKKRLRIIFNPNDWSKGNSICISLH